MSPETFFENFGHLVEAPNGVHKLRELILQLAVQGKLVDQDPNDEPASILLAKIKDELKLLVKSRQIRRPKPVQGIKDLDIPYQVPMSWEWARGGEVFVFVTSGSRGWAKYYSDSGAIFLRIGNLDYGTTNIDLSKTQKVSPPNSTEGTRTKVQSGDLLISITGDTGMVGLVPDGFGEAYINQHISLARPSAYVFPEYLAWCLATNYSLGALKLAQRGIKNSLGLEDIRNLLMPIPPYQEQKRIVRRIKQLMTFCNELEERQQKKAKINTQLNTSALDKLLNSREPDEFDENWQRISNNFDLLYESPKNIVELRRAILQLAVIGKLVPQDPNDEPADNLVDRIKEHSDNEFNDRHRGKSKQLKIANNRKTESIPQGWTWVRLGELGEFCGGATPSKSKASYWDGDIVWVSPKDMKCDEITDSELKITQSGLYNSRLRLIPPNSILFVVRSGILKRKFPVAINRVECTINQDQKALIPYLANLEGYIYLMLKGHERLILNELVKGGVTVQSVKFNEFKSQWYPFPPLQEQKRIIKKVNNLLASCKDLVTAIEYSQMIGDDLTKSIVRHI